MTVHPAPPDSRLAALRLEPDRRRAVAWTVAALILVAMCVWFVGDSRGAVVAWVALAASVAVALAFLVPVIAPELTTVVLDQEGVRGRSYHARVDLRWEEVLVADVVTVAGEPILQLHVRVPSATGDPWRTQAVGILLPLGCDLAALHAFLAARLGRR